MSSPLVSRSRSQLYPTMAREDSNESEKESPINGTQNSLETCSANASKKDSEPDLQKEDAVSDVGNTKPIVQSVTKETTKECNGRTDSLKRACVSNYLSPQRLCNDWSKRRMSQDFTTPPSSSDEQQTFMSPVQNTAFKINSVGQSYDEVNRKQNISHSPSDVKDTLLRQPSENASTTVMEPYYHHSPCSDMNFRHQHSPTTPNNDMNILEECCTDFQPSRRRSDQQQFVMRAKKTRTEKDRRRLTEPIGELKARTHYSHYNNRRHTDFVPRSNDSPLRSPPEVDSDRHMMWASSFVSRSKTYKYTFIDSHCHIDLLYSRMSVTSMPFKEFKEKNAKTFPANYEGCVAVFCNPRTFSSENPRDHVYRTIGKEEGVWFAFGCHPKNATEFSRSNELGLRRALQHPKVVALGEIGLDYSGTFHQHAEVQKQVFRLQLNIAVEMKLPLVIHCRDADEDCLAILQEVVPQDYRIHAHCFTRDINVAQRWMNLFPNLFLGLTPVISYRTALDAANTATHIPLDRLLLETDAPYFIPGNIRNSDVVCSHPGFALFTAEKVAELKRIPVDDVLKACRENTAKMYGI